MIGSRSAEMYPNRKYIRRMEEYPQRHRKNVLEWENSEDGMTIMQKLETIQNQVNLLAKLIVFHSTIRKPREKRG